MNNRPTTYQDHYDNMVSALRYLNDGICKMREGFKGDVEVIDCTDEAEDVINSLSDIIETMGNEIESLDY